MYVLRDKIEGLHFHYVLRLYDHMLHYNLAMTLKVDNDLLLCKSQAPAKLNKYF